MHQANQIIANLLPCDNTDESPSNGFGGVYKGVSMTGNRWQQKRPRVHPLSSFVPLGSRLAARHILETVLQWETQMGGN